jgi:hypothetical protein
MPVHELDLLGLFASPIVAYAAIALVATAIIGWLADRLIPFSLQRNEGLMSLLTFMIILALCMRAAF